MLDDRKLDVLRAIVEDYVATQEPVGSKALVERHNLGVSPATIRNDMAALEDEGYIAQPHTSAGRIPTDKGYRLFVDRLSSVKPLSPAERRAIQSFLDGALDLDDVVARTVRLLATLTRQVAVVQYPSLSRSSVRHVELVPLSATRLLVVLITSTGRVEQRVVEAGVEMPDSLLAELRAQLNAATVGVRLPDAAGRLADLPDRFTEDQRATVGQRARRRCWRAWSRSTRSGSCSAARPTSPGSGPTSRRRSTRCSRRSRSRWCCCGCSARRPTRRSLQVRIGHENPHEGLASTSVVSVGLRRRGRDARQARRPRPDPDGLPRNDGSGARSGPVRRQDRW